jgi:hypothetical protein
MCLRAREHRRLATSYFCSAKSLPRDYPERRLSTGTSWPMGRKRNISKKTTAPNHRLYSRPRLLDYLILRLGVPVALLAFGVGLLTTGYFWAGVVLFYVGLALLAVDLAFEKWVLHRPVKLRIFLGLFYLGSTAVASWAWIFRPAPLEIRATSDCPTFGQGSVIEGVPWQPQYSEINLQIKNPSATDYTDFEAEIETDESIGAIKETNGTSDCKIASAHAPLFIHAQTMKNGVPAGKADDPGSGESYVVVPLGSDGKPVIPASGSDSSYNIYCDRVPAKSEIDFFGALEVTNDIRLSNPSPLIFGPPRPAAWIGVDAHFNSGLGRPRSESVARCPMNSNCESR